MTRQPCRPTKCQLNRQASWNPANAAAHSSACPAGAEARTSPAHPTEATSACVEWLIGRIDARTHRRSTRGQSSCPAGASTSPSVWSGPQNSQSDGPPMLGEALTAPAARANGRTAGETAEPGGPRIADQERQPAPAQHPKLPSVLVCRSSTQAHKLTRLVGSLGLCYGVLVHQVLRAGETRTKVPECKLQSQRRI